jgi:hypothetical protein
MENARILGKPHGTSNYLSLWRRTRIDSLMTGHMLEMWWGGVVLIVCVENCLGLRGYTGQNRGGQKW